MASLPEHVVRPLTRIVPVTAIMLLVACTSGTGPVTGAPPRSSSPTTVADRDWLTYQHDAARSGLTVGSYKAAQIKQLWESAQLDGLVYAQVLVHADRALAVTQNNTVYALDVTTGRTVWSKHLGDPVPLSSLPCGNVQITGILSTPVIDPVADMLYAVDYLTGPGPHHELVGIDLTDGSVRFNARIDPPGANPLTLQQRGSLTLSQGTLYVPFGGLFGDCGDYHGWIVSAAASDGHQTGAYQVPTHRQGGIWTTPAVAATGDLYAVTGNGDSRTNFDHGNAVLRLSPALNLLDFFAPSNWADLSAADADLGSTGPVLLDSGTVLQVGKAGIGYLLRAESLGEMGGQLFQAPVCAGGAYGAGAHRGSTAYIPCRDGLVAVQVQNSSFSVLWHGPQFNAGPTTITDDAIWTLDGNTTAMYALNPEDGSVLFQEPASQAPNIVQRALQRVLRQSPTEIPHFLSPSAAGGRLFHSRGKTIVVFVAST